MSSFFFMMKRRLQLWKKACQSRVADENINTSSAQSEETAGEDNVRVAGSGGSSFWLLMKAPLSCLPALRNQPLPATNNGEEAENISGTEENRRKAQLIWFSNNPAIAERNYLAVQNSMRYVIYM